MPLERPPSCGACAPAAGATLAARRRASYAVNGPVSVRGLAELRSAVARPQPGEPLVLHVERSGRLVYVVVETE